MRPPFTQAIVFSGHMVDSPGRKNPRFHAGCVPAVAESIGHQLAGWDAGPQTLAIWGAGKK